MPLQKIALPFALAPLLFVGACASTSTESPSASVTQSEHVHQVTELYEVHHDGRIYVFYDRSLYENFLQTGHTAYSLNRIGEGPKGETLVYGLTGKDKAKRTGILSVDIHDGKVIPQQFYGEARIDGRIYVFNSLPEFEAVRMHHEAAYRLTDIGAGPKGETVVYVLTSKNKKQRPDALMSAFSARNS